MSKDGFATRGGIAASLVVLCCCYNVASAQVVRIAPIVKLTPTAAVNARFPGVSPPPSETNVTAGSTFYVEIWATNVAIPLDGLACVYVDLFYDRTDLMDSVAPSQNSSLFPIDAVAPVFDDPLGTVGDIGGCQTIPPIGFLGVGEWVLAERVQMTAVGPGGPVTLTLTDANNVFAGTTIIGQLSDVNPVDIDFQARVFTVDPIPQCTTNPECVDTNPCTDDACVGTICVNTPNDLLDPDDGLFCNGVDTCVGGVVVPGTPKNCDDSDPNTTDVCDETNDVCVNTPIPPAAPVVTIAPIVKQTPTPLGAERFAGLTPPASAVRVDPASTFYVEIWATNSGPPQDGLACVHVDLGYDRTDLMDAIPPVASSPLFPTNAVTPVFDDPVGAVGEVGGCQTIPPIGFLGVGEWVLVERITMSAQANGGPVTMSVADAANPFAGTSIIGQLLNIDPADIEFQSRNFVIGECTLDAECDDGDACTADSCAVNTCVNTDTTPAGQCCAPLTGGLTSIDDGDACTADVCNADGTVTHTDTTPAGQCCDPLTGVLTPIDDADACTADVCLPGGTVTHADTTPPGQCCAPLTGLLTLIDDSNVCTTDTCAADGSVTHADTTPAGQCCDPLLGGLTPIDDGDACTADTCNVDGTVTHTDTTPAGQCCAPLTGALTPIDDGTACTLDVCSADGTVTHTDSTPAGQCCAPATGGLSPIDDSDACTADVCNADGTVGHVDTTPIGQCCAPTTGQLTLIDDADVCTIDTCNADGTVTHTDTTTAGQCCDPLTGVQTLIDDADICTTDTCNADGTVTHNDTTPAGQCCDPLLGGLTPIDDGDVCTTDTCNADGTVTHTNTTPAGQCCSPLTGVLTPIDDGDACTADVCNFDGSVSHASTTPPGQCCDPLTGILTTIDDANVCTIDTCDAGGTVTHTDTTPVGQCCDPLSGALAPIDDADVCTTDTCNADGTVTHADTAPVGDCCDPLTGVLTPIDDGDACTADTCNADGTVTHGDTTPPGQCCDPLTGFLTIIDDGDACTGDTCNLDGTVVHASTTPFGFCCSPITGNLIPIDDGDACTFDTCNADGSVIHTDTTPPNQCCNPITGTLTPIDDGDACTADVCTITGAVTHANTTPAGQCCDPVTGALATIDDNNACTDDVCNANGSVTHTVTTPVGQCCNPLSGALTVINDNDACTTDFCSLDGSVTHTDTTPVGFCCDPFTGGLSPINDNNICTIDICNADGTVSHFNNPGACSDGDLCTVNDACIAGECVGIIVDPLCTPALDLNVAPPPIPEGPGGTCFGVGDLITVSILMGDSTPLITGGQFFLEYDTDTLDVVSIVPGDPPFTLQIFESVDDVAGTIDYAVAAPPGESSSLPSTLAVITFQAVAECDSFVRFRTHEPPTVLTDVNGIPRDPILGLPNVFTVNNSPPVFGGCPTQTVVNADAGTFGAHVTWTPITATDSCDGPTVVSCDATSGGNFPIGTTAVTCQSANSCGAIGTCQFDVVVRPVSTMFVSVQLSPLVAPGPLTRCITFDLIQCGFVQQTVSEPIVFTNGLALEVPVEVPAGFYGCVTARDELHTLRTTSADFADLGDVFAASFVGDIDFGGHGLTGGNLNGNDFGGFIDIIDFSIWSNNFGLSFADTDCTVPAPHADINGDGIVNGLDFTFIALNFLKANEPDCCDFGVLGGEAGPRLSVTVEELREMGYGDLSTADRDNNGVVDLTDVNLFVNQHPELTDDFRKSGTMTRKR